MLHQVLLQHVHDPLRADAVHLGERLDGVQDHEGTLRQVVLGDVVGKLQLRQHRADVQDQRSVGGDDVVVVLVLVVDLARLDLALELVQLGPDHRGIGIGDGERPQKVLGRPQGGVLFRVDLLLLHAGGLLKEGLARLEDLVPFRLLPEPGELAEERLVGNAH